MADIMPVMVSLSSVFSSGLDTTAVVHCCMVKDNGSWTQDWVQVCPWLLGGKDRRILIDSSSLSLVPEFDMFELALFYFFNHL